MPLSGRRALITGGSRGIGAGVAQCLARDGADVGIVYRRDDAAAEATVQRLRTHGGTAIALRADVGDPRACAKAAEAALGMLGRIDILVHCAGRATHGYLVADTPGRRVRDGLCRTLPGRRVPCRRAAARHALAQAQ